jgi:hypothetical protein
MTNAGLMYSGSWSYKIGDGDYIHYTITDTITDEILAEGNNKLNFINFSIGIIPKYYLLPGKKWNPYLFAGLNINYTHANFTDNWWKAAKELEYSTGDKLSVTFAAGYSSILLNKQNFKSESLIENFNAFFFQAGIRLSFLKSKDF